MNKEEAIAVLEKIEHTANQLIKYFGHIGAAVKPSERTAANLGIEINIHDCPDNLLEIAVTDGWDVNVFHSKSGSPIVLVSRHLRHGLVSVLDIKFYSRSDFAIELVKNRITNFSEEYDIDFLEEENNE